MSNSLSGFSVFMGFKLLFLDKKQSQTPSVAGEFCAQYILVRGQFSVNFRKLIKYWASVPVPASFKCSLLPLSCRFTLMLS